MPYVFTPYSFFALIPMVIAGTLALYAARHRSVPGATPFAVLMAAITEWSAGYALEILGADLPTKVFWGKVQYLGIVVAPVAWFMFAQLYNQARQWEDRRRLAALAVIPTLTVLLAATTEQHGLVWSSVALDDTAPFLALAVGHGAWFWIHTAFSYLMLLLGTVLLLRHSLRRQGLYRRQVMALVVAAVSPWVGNAVVLSGLNPWAPLDLTPLAFTVTGTALGLAVFQFRLLDLAPIARETVVEAMADGMLVLDAQNRVVDINPAAARLLAVSPGAAISRPAAEVFQHWPHLVQRYQGVDLSTDEISLGEGPTQRHYEVRVSPLLDRRQRLAGRVLVAHDVTGRKRAAEVQRRDAEWMRALYNITLDLLNHREIDDLLQTIVERAVVLLNAPYGEIMLLEGDEFVVRAFTKNQAFLRGDRVKRSEARLTWQAHDTRRPVVVDDYANWPHRRALYDSVPITAVAVIPILSGDQCLGVLDLSRSEAGRPFDADQLQVGELLAQLAAVVLRSAQLYAQSQEANRLKSRLLANISHDVRTPLGAILGNTEMLQVGVYGDINDQQATALTEIIASTNLLLDFVNNLIGQSEIESGKVILKVEPFEPASLLEVLQSTAKVLAQSKGLALISTVDPALPARLMGDAYRLRQILLNLLSNAVKFTPQGSVAVRLQRVDDTHWALQVADTGPGIPADVQARVFEAFWKGPASRSHATPLGSGLGLAVVKELTTLMGGQVTLDSALGQGSTFTVTLPLVAVPELETAG